jgi:4-carboxymuconolactone decarboxylase
MIGEFLPSPSPLDAIAPDYAVIADQLMWGAIWAGPELEPQLRIIATITAQCVNGWDFGVRHQVRAGLGLGLSPATIKGLLTELLFYVGLPASVSALLVAQEVIDEREEWRVLDVAVDREWLDSVEERSRRGQQARSATWGVDADEELSSSATHTLLPDVALVVGGLLYGEMWARSPLLPEERMVAILAALMCRGHLAQFGRHVGYALEMGMTGEAICEVVAQAGWYRGWPHVEDALGVVMEVLADRSDTR